MRRVCIGLALAVFQFDISRVAATPVEAQDAHSRIIRLEYIPQRIVTLGPSVTELAFAAGAGSQIIAVDNASDYPEAVKSRQRVGSFVSLDLEKIIALQPDLILVWSTGYRSVPLDQVAQAVPVYYLEPRQLADIPKALEVIGRLTRNQDRAKQVADQFRRQWLQLQQHYRDRARLRGFYQVWAQPLMTIGGTHVINDVMQLCKIDNVFSSSRLLVPRVDVETVLHRQPELLIVPKTAWTEEQIAAWQAWWPDVDSNYIVIDADHLTRHSPRLLEGAAQLCQQADRFRRHQR